MGCSFGLGIESFASSNADFMAFLLIRFESTSMAWFQLMRPLYKSHLSQLQMHNRHVPVRGHGYCPQMKNFAWFCPPNGTSNLEIYIGKEDFCPSKVSVKASSAPLGMTSIYVVDAHCQFTTLKKLAMSAITLGPAIMSQPLQISFFKNLFKKAKIFDDNQQL